MSKKLKLNREATSVNAQGSKRKKPEGEEKKEFKKVIKEVKIPEQISIQELSNVWQKNQAILLNFYLI